MTASPSDFDWAVRTTIYAAFGESGQAPPIGRIAATVGGTEHQVRTSLDRLFEAHEIAPLSNRDGVWMANPFSGVPTAYTVETPVMTCYANCAWDALGVPAMLESDGWTRTRCAQSGVSLDFGVEGGSLKGEAVIHLVTPIRHAWDDIGFT